MLAVRFQARAGKHAEHVRQCYARVAPCHQCNLQCGEACKGLEMKRQALGKYEVVPCAVCGAVFKARACDIAKGWGRHCSKTCANVTNGKRFHEIHDQSGDKNHRWAGGELASVMRYRQNNPEKLAAHRAVSRAVESGRLERKPCEVCGATKTEGHHDDYSKPLDVRWLCRKHHLGHHRNAATASQHEE